jgi:hypothetical protein
VLSPNHPRCSNCGVTDSPLWRRDPEGNTVCNACGELFFSSQSHNPLCFPIGPLLRVGLNTCLPDATVNLLISFPSSHYSTFKKGGLYILLFLLVFCITMSQSRVSESCFIPNMDQLLAMPYPCSFVSKTITLVLTSNNRDTVVPRVS